MKKVTTLAFHLFLSVYLFSQSIVSISPNTGNAGQTLDVTITGSNTHFTQGSGTSVSFYFNQGSSTINSVNVISNTVLVANITIPPNTYTGSYTVYTYNDYDYSVYKYNGFYVNGVIPPSLVSVSPSFGNAGQTLDVTITGANTHFIQGSETTVNFGFGQGSSTVNSIDVLSETKLIAHITIPAHTYTDYYDVSIYNYFDGYVYKYDAFYVNGLTRPSLISVNPNMANAGQTLDVTITGANTHFTQGSATVYFGFGQGSSTVNSINIINETTLTANVTIPVHTYTGSYSASIYNSFDDYVSKNNAIYINGLTRPSLVSVSPNTANAGQTLDVTITGANTYFSQGSGTSVVFGFNQGSSTVNNINVINDTKLIVNITIPPRTYTGDYSVSFSNSLDGYVTKYNCFHVNALPTPTILSVSPNTGKAGQTLDVTITGSNTHFTQGSATVSFGFNQGSNTINSISVNSETEMIVNITIPEYTYYGNYYVSAYNNYDGYIYGTDRFYVDGRISLKDITESIAVYPNPTSEKIIIESISFINDGKTTISILNTEGQVQLMQLMQQTATAIDITSLANGMYFIKVEDSNGVMVKKFIKE